MFNNIYQYSIGYMIYGKYNRQDELFIIMIMMTKHTLPKLSTISFTRAFMGATYTILNLSLSTDP